MKLSDLPGARVNDDGSVTVTFPIVGSLKRTTLERDYPDPAWERLSDAQNWCACTRLQAERLITSFWRERQSGQRLYAFLRRDYGATSFDEHCLLVAARNLDRALARLKRAELGNGLPLETREATKLLRNVYEHWDTLRSGYRHGRLTRDAKELAEKYPAAEPWLLELHQDGDVVAWGQVSLKTLIKDIRSLEARLWRQLRRLRREGRHVARKQPLREAAGKKR